MPRTTSPFPVRKNVEIDPKACVEEGAKLGKNIKIGPFTTVFSDSVLEDACVIGSHCVIGHPSKIQLQKTDFSASSPKVAEFLVKETVTRVGEHSIIRSGSIVYRNVRIGKRLRTGHNILIREHVTLGDSCVVGTQAILDGYIEVGKKSMIQSQCYITQSVKIGDGVFIAPNCLFFDNKRIILGEGLAGSTVEDYVRIGGGTRVLPEVTIGKYALIGAGSLVSKDIPPRAVAYGVPAKVRRFQSEDEIRKYVTSIMGWQ